LQTSPERRWFEAALAWHFVAVWGSGPGLLMHAVHLGGSHYTQYLGMSAKRSA
jgi:hypothetical protein